jgi:hypothetical protein
MIKRIKLFFDQIYNISKKIDDLQIAIGRIENRQVQTNTLNDIIEYEFKVTSQWGEDGIIQFLINKIPIKNKIFVEFGVESYQEANTRFLLLNNNWSGLVIDGSELNINKVKKDPIYWRYNLKAINHFINKDNINSILENNGIVDEIGLLSIDIDGNDYWVWESISIIKPQIVICEYNSIFGSELKISTIYDEMFIRSKAHYSNLYYGASISALEYLANKKGYVLVGSNSAGNNVFFVKNEYASLFKTKTPLEAYVKSQFRESRSKDGTLLLTTASENVNLINTLNVQDVESGKIYCINELDLKS